MCAHAVRVAVEELPGVDSVHVSLNDGYADIALGLQNAITVEQVRQVIRKNGFSPRQARVRVRGIVTQRDSTFLLMLPSGASFALFGTGEPIERIEAMVGSPVTIDGEVPASTGDAAVETGLRVVRISQPG